MPNKVSAIDDNLAAEIATLRSDSDDVERWKKVAELGRRMNPQILAEHKKQMRAMRQARKHKLYRKDRGEGQLRFGVSMPPMTWELLISSDIMVKGSSRLYDPEKNKYSTKDATNGIVQDLMEAFPEYRAY